jgi:hypothetical protein
MTPSPDVCPDRGVRWLDPDGLEVEANPLARFVVRAERRPHILEVGDIQSVAGVAARSDLDDVQVVDVAVALRCQVRNDPGKSNLAVLCVICVFPGDENVASSPPSPQTKEQATSLRCRIFLSFIRFFVSHLHSSQGWLCIESCVSFIFFVRDSRHRFAPHEKIFLISFIWHQMLFIAGVSSSNVSVFSKSKFS